MYQRPWASTSEALARMDYTDPMDYTMDNTEANHTQEATQHHQCQPPRAPAAPYDPVHDFEPYTSGNPMSQNFSTNPQQSRNHQQGHFWGYSPSYNPGGRSNPQAEGQPRYQISGAEAPVYPSTHFSGGNRTPWAPPSEMRADYYPPFPPYPSRTGSGTPLRWQPAEATRTAPQINPRDWSIERMRIHRSPRFNNETGEEILTDLHRGRDAARLQNEAAQRQNQLAQYLRQPSSSSDSDDDSTRANFGSVSNRERNFARLEREEAAIFAEERRMAAARSSLIAARKKIPSKEALASLLDMTVEEIKAEKEDLNCSICYNNYGEASPEGDIETPVRLPKCKHVFGKKCLMKWFEDADTCPYCRDKLPSENTIRNIPDYLTHMHGPGWAGRLTATQRERLLAQYRPRTTHTDSQNSPLRRAQDRFDDHLYSTLTRALAMEDDIILGSSTTAPAGSPSRPENRYSFQEVANNTNTTVQRRHRSNRPSYGGRSIQQPHRFSVGSLTSSRPAVSNQNTRNRASSGVNPPTEEASPPVAIGSYVPSQNRLPQPVRTPSGSFQPFTYDFSNPNIAQLSQHGDLFGATNASLQSSGSATHPQDNPLTGNATGNDFTEWPAFGNRQAR